MSWSKRSVLWSSDALYGWLQRELLASVTLYAAFSTGSVFDISVRRVAKSSRSGVWLMGWRFCFSIYRKEFILEWLTKTYVEMARSRTFQLHTVSQCSCIKRTCLRNFPHIYRTFKNRILVTWAYFNPLRPWAGLSNKLFKHSLHTSKKITRLHYRVHLVAVA